MAYILMFSVSTALVCCSERLYKHANKNLGRAVAILMVLFVSIFAGIRSTGVGTDTEYYLVKHFNWAQQYKNHISQFINYMYKTEEVDYLYIILLYFCANCFRNIHVLMFALSLITNIFVYLALKQNRRQMSLAAGWLIYCFAFFNTTLNIVRQSCAIAIVFYLISAYNQNNISKRQLVYWSITAILFHRTAVLAVLIFLAFSIFNSKKKYTYLLVTLTALICAFPILFEAMISFLKNLNLLPIRYRIYFDINNSEQSSVFLDAIVYMLPTMGLIICTLKCHKNSIAMYISIGLICVVTYLKTNLLMNRLSYYFIIYFSVSAPVSARIMAKNIESRILYEWILIFGFALLWAINIIVFNYGQTYPYLMG